MGQTKIEWTDTVWNPVTGCTPVSEGCEHCYARSMARRFWKDRKFSDVRVHWERLDEPLHWRKPRRVFVCSMSDLFHEKVSFGYRGEILRTMDYCNRHIFQVLTKRIERAVEFCSSESLLPVIGRRELPPNIWMGVSVENQKRLDERAPYLLQIPAAVRFVSFEPLLGPVDLEKYNCRCLRCDGCGDEYAGEPTTVCHVCGGTGMGSRLDWVIVGGESGPGARPMDPDWARGIRDQCRDAGVPFFMKQLGGFPNKKAKLEELPADLRIRQCPNF